MLILLYPTTTDKPKEPRYSQCNGGTCVKGDCYNGYGKCYLREVGDRISPSSYSGYWKKGHFNGKGTLLETNSDGVTALSKGEFFSGSFRKGYLKLKGVEYRGRFILGKVIHGEGSVIAPNGDKIFSSFVAGKPKGHTRVLFSDGKEVVAILNNKQEIEKIISSKGFENESLFSKKELLTGLGILVAGKILGEVLDSASKSFKNYSNNNPSNSYSDSEKKSEKSDTKSSSRCSYQQISELKKQQLGGSPYLTIKCVGGKKDGSTKWIYYNDFNDSRKWSTTAGGFSRDYKTLSKAALQYCGCDF